MNNTMPAEKLPVVDKEKDGSNTEEKNPYLSIIQKKHRSIKKKYVYIPMFLQFIADFLSQKTHLSVNFFVPCVYLVGWKKLSNWKNEDQASLSMKNNKY